MNRIALLLMASGLGLLSQTNLGAQTDTSLTPAPVSVKTADSVTAPVEKTTPLVETSPEPLRASPIDALPLSEAEPEIKLFNDPGLATREYGFGVVGGVVAGSLGFFIGSGLESAIFGNRAKNGTLEFTGIRYDNFHGSFYGGSAGIWLGSALTAYFVGEVDEEKGSVLLTLLGGAATTAASYALASAMGVHDEAGLLPFIPLTLLPPTGAVLAYNVSRYFGDKRRLRETRKTSHIQAPSFQLGFNSHGPRMQVNALKVSF